MTSLTSLCILGRGIKGSMHETQELVGWSIPVDSVILFSLFLWLVPWLVYPGSHRPSHLANAVPLKEGNCNYTGKCSLFVRLYILKLILGTLSHCALVVCELVG